MLAISAFLLVETLQFFSIVESAVRTCKTDNDEDWSYHGTENGPSLWGEKYPNCYGREQSPVAIDTDEVVTDRELSPLLMENYVKPVTRATIVNNGHTIQLTPQDGVARTIEVEGSTYTLQQFHFHWGSDDFNGSEHTLDNKTFGLEAQFVHTNSKNNIAVVGVFFQTVAFDNKHFEPVVKALRRIKYKGESTSLKSPLHLDDLLPNNPPSFYRYRGSLTTPGCDEGVIWSILEGEIKMGFKQLRSFWRLFSSRRADDRRGCNLWNNGRPVQPLNGRVIYKSFQ